MAASTNSVALPVQQLPLQVGRVAAWDWRDGPTEGLLQVNAGDDTYYFRLLEERMADAEDEDIRIFGLYPSRPELFDEFVTEVGAHHPPHWPIWWPVWNFPDEAVANRMNQLVGNIKEDAGSLMWIVATNNSFKSLRAFSVLEQPVV